MTGSVVRVVLLLALAACDEASQPIAPNKPRPVPVAVVAVYQHPTMAAVQYNLFMNGTFELHHGEWPPYYGTFNASETLISFDFSSGVSRSWCKEAWCTVWLAMGRLRGDTLRVEYDQATSWLLCNDLLDSEVCNDKRAAYIRVK